MKGVFDILVSLIFLIFLAPLFIVLAFLIFVDDFGPPFYVAKRVGKGGVEFNMIKFRSMRRIDSLTYIVSTSENDPRITKIGKLIRKYKIDELSQLFNVFTSKMSIVGPRPNVKVEVDLYTDLEIKILSIKPGITDFSSIIFFDLNKILSNSQDPNTDYNQLVRPWKSRLALLYIENNSLLLDIKLIILTFVGIFSKKASLFWLKKLLQKYNAQQELLDLCKIDKVLKPYPPPGSKEIVTSDLRNGIIY
ncbi:MAG: sugar transferase [Bacteroidota bacterium]